MSRHFLQQRGYATPVHSVAPIIKGTGNLAWAKTGPLKNLDFADSAGTYTIHNRQFRGGAQFAWE